MKKNCFGIIILLAVFTLTACASLPTDYYMFSDITECSLLEANLPEGAVVTRLHARDEDEEVAKLSIGSSYAIDVQCEAWQAKLFAYAFSSEDQAKTYFRKVTGKESTYDTNYSAVRGMTRCRMVVIDGKHAYQVITSAQSVTEVNQWLKNSFRLKLSVSDGTVKTVEQ